MPEGDVVWRTASQLDAALTGRKLMQSDFPVPRHATTDLSGRNVTETVSRGKHLLTRVEGDITVHTHLKMEGSWRISAPARYPLRDHRIRLIPAHSHYQAVGMSLGIVDVIRTSREDAAVGHRPPLSAAACPSWMPRPSDSFSGSRQVYLTDGESRRRGMPAMRETQLDRACQSNLGVLGKVRRLDLNAPTPCVAWDVRALVNHFIGAARWWAAMMTGADEPAEKDYAAGDLVAAYKASIGVAAAAFEADGAMEKMVLLPFGDYPGTVVLGMAALDQFTHGWDLARALGLPTDLDPALAGELLNQARQTIPDAFRGPDGQAPFGPAFEAPAGAGPADQLAAFLGRRV